MAGEEGGSGVVHHVDTGSYVLRPLVQDIPLSAEEHTSEARITSVELCDDNLYIGTSQAEILHFVSIPSDPPDESQEQYIFASRLQPAYAVQTTSQSRTLPGVQTILVLPTVQKACILCNGTLSFYSLPELSPAFNNITVPNCTWVGGIDLSTTLDDEDGGVSIMICVRSRVRLVKIRDEARQVRDIKFPGCLKALRRRNFACVADEHAYALLDVENQQKISLFPISSLNENSSAGKVENISSNPEPNNGRSSNLSRPVSRGSDLDSKSHGRSSSLGAFVGGLGRRQGSPQPGEQGMPGTITPEQLSRATSPSQGSSHIRNVSTPEAPNLISSTPEKALPLPPPRVDSLRGHSPARLATQMPLAPHISSPTPGEFMLTTGTGIREPGVGIFVNLDGDVVRGTLQFDQYPRAVVLEGAGIDTDSSVRSSPSEEREGFVLASMSRLNERRQQQGGFEVQRWDLENGGVKEWVAIPDSDHEVEEPYAQESYGLQSVNTIVKVPFPEIGTLLRSCRLKLSRDSTMRGQEALEDWEKRRNDEEINFARRLSGRNSRTVVWSGQSIWWVVRTPLVAKLNNTIEEVVKKVPKGEAFSELTRSEIIQIINGLRGIEASSETEFLSLEFIRQKSSLILFADLIVRSSSLPNIGSSDFRITEGLLTEGGIDPRVPLSLVPLLNEEVIEGQRGIWIHSGLLSVIERYRSKIRKPFEELRTTDLPNLLKRYLGSWRQRKGFGSIADEKEVFQTVDAALLRILLEQDAEEPSRPSKPSPTRIELYAIVDSGVDCFERAISLLEKYKQLYILSRLYQSRRMARKVLETWKRIIEGERDEGGGLSDGEHEVRKYLVNIKDTSLVDDYGTWLARRNPALGVQVFTNDSSRVKWEPRQAVMLLRRKAPEAVKVYLEHLVFGKKNIQYANDLISYYLDSVLSVLGSSEEARAILAQSYESYRALHPPKPTYRQFIIENDVPLSWWHDRLRLLELIGGTHGSDFSYDIGQVLTRIEPFEEDLVPESIILDGRQGRHKQALRLLTHGLGDYHTAINYCLLGGASIFHPTSGSASTVATPTQEEQAVLFGYLLTEFLRIEDVSDRLERTSELLERFGAWYNVRDVLELLPESWSVKLVSGFLVSSFRRLTHERNEAVITKALSGAENLQIASAFVEKCTAIGPHREDAP
ncbi:hypothetical protein ACLMJK_002322 [Lecanora helva]